MTDIQSPPDLELDPDMILATVSPSGARRFMGISVLSVLGGGLLFIGLTKPPADLGWLLFMVGFGVGTLALAEALRRATGVSLELTPTELRESNGRRVLRVDQVAAVERGTFAIKPSNGFLIRLSETPEGGGHWAPGLWWRLGRRVGVGGITSASESKTMAEVLSALVVHRKRGGGQSLL